MEQIWSTPRSSPPGTTTGVGFDNNVTQADLDARCGMRCWPSATCSQRQIKDNVVGNHPPVRARLHPGRLDAFAPAPRLTAGQIQAQGRVLRATRFKPAGALVARASRTAASSAGARSWCPRP